MGQLTIPGETGQVSDGFHTFDELYAHRCRLFIALMQLLPEFAWWSRRHHDGGMPEGWVIAGLDLPSGAVTYHLPESDVPLLRVAQVREIETAPPWDGHNSQDVLSRLERWLLLKRGDAQ